VDRIDPPFLLEEYKMKYLRTLACMAIVAVGGIVGQAQGGGALVLDTQLVASGFTKPNFVTHAPGDFDHIYILEQDGRIYRHNLDAGTRIVFMDIQSVVDHVSNEQGLLGLAFHPNYDGEGTGSGMFYVNYTALSPNNDTVIASYSTTGNLGNSASEVRLMVIDQPFTNHNGGWIGFGADNYLYIATGDGGSADDPGNRGQDTDVLLGKILRIDVDGNNSGNGLYGIPATNPLPNDGDATNNDQPEIWAFGLRNPWRNSFDRETGDFYIGDVGQDAREEVDFQDASSTGGENYGWRCREGNINTPNVFPSCNPTPRVEPVYVYNHTNSPFRCTVVGGYVYRGCEIPELDGTYFCNEYCSNEVWTFKINGTGDGITGLQQISSQIGISNGVSWGEDAYGELYIVTQGNDAVYKVIATSGATLTDCNENGIQDACEILDGSALDANEDDIPDSCQVPASCAGDANGDLVVDVNDISYVLFRLGNAGFPGTVDGDVNCTGVVDVNDISYVLFRLGVCDDPAPC
jgi:glucose/arabinose dehydrogenase